MTLFDSVPATDKPLDDLRQRLDTLHLTQESDHTELSQFPRQICEGSIQRWQLRPGLDLMIHDLTFREKAVVKRGSSGNTPHLGMSFCLAGQIRGLSPEAQQEVRLQPGRVSFGVINGTSRQIEYAARQRVSLVHLHIQPEALRLSTRETVEQFPGPLRNILTGGEQAAYFRSQVMTTVMGATVRQLLACPYQGLAQRLYLESKTLELVGLCFDQLLSNWGTPCWAADLKADDVERIVHARDLLLSQVTNPPTLLELSHQAGLNDRKLKQGFRQVFGTTVFGYLHTYRMHQAKQLLIMPEATIASVAQAIGYRNPEAFSVAFRRTFAITPKAYQLQHR